MQSLRSFTPALTTDDKESRGFKHPQIGHLLVKSNMVSQWDNDEEYVIHVSALRTTHNIPLATGVVSKMG